MKNCRLCIPCLALAVLLSAGCESTRISNRIKEKPTVFAALAPDQKVYVKDGIVFPGDSVEMAYIALGNPDSIETRQKDDISVIMWTYEKYYPSGPLAKFLTDYSRSKNYTLLRKVDLNLRVGQVNAVDNAPGLEPGVVASSTHTEGVMNKLDLPDIPIYRLYVFYYRGKISDVKIESLDGTVLLWLEEAIEMEKANERRKAKMLGKIST